MHYNYSMKKSENGTKKKKIDVLLVLAILLFIVGVALLLVDPIRTYLRNKKAQEGLNVIEAQISENIAANATSEDGQEPFYCADKYELDPPIIVQHQL